MSGAKTAPQQCFRCNPCAATVGAICGACLDRERRAKRVSEEEAHGGDTGVSAWDYEPDDG